MSIDAIKSASGWTVSPIAPGQLKTSIDPVTGLSVVDSSSLSVMAASGVSSVGPRGVPLSGHSYFPMDTNRTNLSTAPVDVTPNARSMSLGAGITAAECNANAGYATTKAAVNGHLLTAWQPNWATDSFVMAFVMNGTAPGVTSFIAGACDYVDGPVGLSFAVATDGKLRVFISANGTKTAGTGLAYIAGSTVVVADGADHKVGIAYDHRQRAMYIWIDGVLVFSGQNAVTPIASASAGAWTQAFALGVNKVGNACQAVKFKHINIYSKTGGTLPANLNTVMSTYSTTPQNIWPLFDQNTKDVGLWTAGQSNQMGYGGTANAINTGLGTPLQDPLYPNGVSGRRSMYPSCAGVLGAAGYKLNVYNYAVGSSGIVENWVGNIQTWVNGGLIKIGGYRAYGGRIYKAALSTGINGMPNCTTPPTNGGVDGTITWTDVGPDTGFRGTVPFTSPYFDPNGYIGLLTASLAASDSPRKFVYVAFGETDAEMNQSRADYSAAFVAFAQAVLSAGAHKVGFGHTFGRPAWITKYTTDLIPGMQDALGSFANDKRVFASLNKYALLGSLATAPASGVGFIADGLHGNDAAYDDAGTALGNNLLTVLQTMA